MHAQALSAEELQLLQPQQTNEARMKATALAQRLGQTASAPGFEAILQTKNQRLLGDYAYGYVRSQRSVVPAEIEALMVRDFNADPNFRWSFMRMISEGNSKYRTEALYRLLLSALAERIAEAERWKSSAALHSGTAPILQAILNTDLTGSEAALLDLVRRIPIDSRPTSSASYWSTAHGAAVQFFARRKYAPAIPYVAALLKVSVPNADAYRSESGALLSALERIDPAAAAREGRALFERLSRMPYSHDVRIEMQRTFLVLRRTNAPFTAAELGGLLKDKPANDPLAASVVRALVDIPQPEALEAVLARAAIDPEDTLAALGALREPLRLDLARLRQVLPPNLSDKAVSSHIALIGLRRDGVPDLIAYLPRPQPGVNALERIIAFDSPEVWREARAGLERLNQAGQIAQPRYAYARARLDELIADPEKHFAAKRSSASYAALQEERSKLDRFRIAANRASGSDPATYAAQMEQWLAALEALQSKYAALPGAKALQADRTRGTLELAAHFRFAEKRPDKAAALYEKVRALPHTEGEYDIRPLADFLLGDLYQFDLSDRAKALQQYTAALSGFERIRSSGRASEHGVAAWWTNSLRAEIEYLKTGRRFAGTLTRDEAFGVFGASILLSHSSLGATPHAGHLAKLAAMASPGDPAKIDRTRLAAALDELPPSRLNLLAVLSLLSLLPDDKRILDYLARHDPSGYASACFLGAVPYFDRLLKDEPKDEGRSRGMVSAMLPGLVDDARGNGLRRASERFLKERGVRLHVAAVDPRKASPEATWKLFIESLRQGDLQTAFGCLTGELRQKLEPRLSGMPAKDLQAMANSFSALQMGEKSGEFREALVTRGNRAGLVYFIRVDGEWKIQEM